MAALLHHHHHSKIAILSVYINTHPHASLSVTFLILHSIALSLSLREFEFKTLPSSSFVFSFSKQSSIFFVTFFLWSFFTELYLENNGTFYQLWRLDGPEFVEASPRQRSRQHLSWAGMSFFFFFFLNHCFCLWFLCFFLCFLTLNWFIALRNVELVNESLNRILWSFRVAMESIEVKLDEILIRNLFLLLLLSCFLLSRNA